MNSKYFIGIGVSSMLILSPLVSFAQESTGTTSTETDTEETSETENGSKPKPTPRNVVRAAATGTKPLPAKVERELEQREKKMERASTTAERKEEAQERKEEARERMEERKGEVLKRISNQMITRMNAAIERYVKLADRVDSRIAKLKEKNIDTSKAEANIAIARTKIQEAKEAVALATTGIEGAAATADNTASSTKPVDAGKAVRESLKNARTAVEAAHKAIVEAIKSLRANEKKANTTTTGTSTATTTGA